MNSVERRVPLPHSRTEIALRVDSGWLRVFARGNKSDDYQRYRLSLNLKEVLELRKALDDVIPAMKEVQTMNENEKYELSHAYSVHEHLNKLAEEVAELKEVLDLRVCVDTSIAKTDGKINPFYVNLFEEMADVSIKIETVVASLASTTLEGDQLFKRIRQYKVDRQLVRLATGNEKWGAHGWGAHDKGAEK